MDTLKFRKESKKWITNRWHNRLARFLSNSNLTRWIARLIWRRATGVCDYYGIYAGFDSVIWAKGFTCWQCHTDLRGEKG